MPTFDYTPAQLRDLHVVTEKVKSKAQVKHVLLKDEPLLVTDRFWQSLFSRYGFNKQVFKYFGHAEVFDRIATVAPSDAVTCCVERNDNGTSRLLATSNPNKSAVKYDDLLELLSKHGTLPDENGATYDYSDGVVRSTHAPKYALPWSVGGDTFQNRFVLDTPIDGYAQPSLYLMILREICTNGAIAQAPAFRSKLALGKGEDSFDYPIVRALEGFNNEEGFEALRNRLEMAQKSWASIYETQKLYKHLARLHGRGQIQKGKVAAAFLTDQTAGYDDQIKIMEGSPLFKSFNSMVGDITKAYGLANLDALSTKRQRTLPAPCKVYDLLNFASETATHYADAAGGRYMQGYIGELVGSGEDYDLEGTCEKFTDWRDFLVLDKGAIESKAELDQMA
jgi:hypothetical protein